MLFLCPSSSFSLVCVSHKGADLIGILFFQVIMHLFHQPVDKKLCKCSFVSKMLAHRHRKMIAMRGRLDYIKRSYVPDMEPSSVDEYCSADLISVGEIKTVIEFLYVVQWFIIG